jgi:tRNA dimethylallyltransferase
MAAVPHHMVDMIEPHEGFSCGDFVRTAAPVIFDILNRGKTPGAVYRVLE